MNISTGMNVLILTPDAVGSTLLQRMLTIYMQFHDFGRPVINLHELTNGLHKYYSPEFNQEIVSKHKLENWGYYQTLEQVVGLLSSVNHYKTSRLAHYHLVRRGDSLDQQIPFYNYLNENFLIIACRRHNIFEHALSMTLNTITKKLNVYDAYEKIDAFFDLYQQGIDLDINAFNGKLFAYKRYVDWSEQHFEISRYFNYEDDVPNIEQFILNLPMFSNQPQLTTWDKNFGISFNQFNQTHYAMSDIGSLDLNQVNRLSFEETLLLENTDAVKEYQQLAPADWPAVNSLQDLKNLPSEIKQDFLTNTAIHQQGVVPLLEPARQEKIKSCLPGYHLATHTINQMVDLGIIINGPPIKKQTLKEKQKIIKNFNQCVDAYNRWIINYPELGKPVNYNDINDRCCQEQNFWHSINNTAPKLSHN
jgi:hypothetical protein